MGYWTQGQPQLPLTGLRVEHLQAMGPPSHQEPEQTQLMPAPEDPAQVRTLQAHVSNCVAHTTWDWGWPAFICPEA